MAHYQGQEPEEQPKILAQNIPFQPILNSTQRTSTCTQITWGSLWSRAWDSNKAPGDADAEGSVNTWCFGGYKRKAGNTE